MMMKSKIEKLINTLFVILLVTLIAITVAAGLKNTDKYSQPKTVELSDGCDYVITHKGDCKHCIERQQILFGNE